MGQIDRLREAGVDLKQLSRFGVEIFFHPGVSSRVFHADMHPGNILVAADGRYIALDFGIVGSLTDYDKHYLAVNFLAFFNRDYKRVATAHIESGWVPKDTRVEELEAAVRTVCEPILTGHCQKSRLAMCCCGCLKPAGALMWKSSRSWCCCKNPAEYRRPGPPARPDLDLWQTAKPFW